MTMSVDGQSVDDVRFILSYGYLAEADTMVPIDARAVFVSGDDATYEYADQCSSVGTMPPTSTPIP